MDADDQLAQLLSLGFDDIELCRAALTIHPTNLEAAIDWCVLFLC